VSEPSCSASSAYDPGKHDGAEGQQLEQRVVEDYLEDFYHSSPRLRFQMRRPKPDSQRHTRFVVTIRAIQSWNMQTVYEAAGGRDGLLRLASAWHTRVLEDEVVSHAFSHGYHPQHSERLAAYWAEALGGPTMYSDQYGDETSVVRIHSGNGLHEEMDQRAIACFDQALEDVGLARDERLRRVLHDYFAWATTITMSRYHHSAEDVPDGLQIPKWSWDGRVA
jgi:hemoglobin